jgi:hypothetical protein
MASGRPKAGPDPHTLPTSKPLAHSTPTHFTAPAVTTTTPSKKQSPPLKTTTPPNSPTKVTPPAPGPAPPWAANRPNPQPSKAKPTLFKANLPLPPPKQASHLHRDLHLRGQPTDQPPSLPKQSPPCLQNKPSPATPKQASHLHRDLHLRGQHGHEAGELAPRAGGAGGHARLGGWGWGWGDGVVRGAGLWVTEGGGR